MSSKFTFNNHDNLKGKHALFPPSQSAWLRYDEEKIAEKVKNQYRTTLGTEIHDFAASQIDFLLFQQSFLHHISTMHFD